MPATDQQNTVGRMIVIEDLENNDAGRRLAHDVYVRSWPTTAAGVYTAEEMDARFEQVSDPGFWGNVLGTSTRKVHGWVTVDGTRRHGFAAAERCPGASGGEDGSQSWEFGWIFVEPEAFGSGLAAALYDEVIEDGSSSWHTFILEGNPISPRFFAARGWVHVDAPQPDWAVALGHPYGRWELRNRKP